MATVVAASVDRSVTGPTTATMNLAFPDQITSVGIYIFAKSFEIDYFANAFPYKYKTQRYQQRQVWYRNASLGRHADRCALAEFMEDNRVVTWHCFHGNALFGI